MTVSVASFRRTGRFQSDFNSAPVDVQIAAAEALKLLQQNPRAKVLRLHPLRGFGKPSIFKVDVFANHAWQITFELEEGNVAKLCRLARHKSIDKSPRAD